MADTYTHGHHEAVLENHRWRTVANSAQFVRSKILESTTILDAGCGPGTISAEISKIASAGSVTAVDFSAGVIDQARAAFPLTNYPNLFFSTGDVYALEFPDNNFDLVYAHQLLQHLTRPVDALTEFLRVLKPGGYVAVRDADYSAFTWSPDFPALDNWRDIYIKVARQNGANPDGGALLSAWVEKAGFVDICATTSSWIFTSDSERKWWGSTWSERVLKSDFAKQSIEYGFATSAELDDISRTFLDWADTQGASFTVPHGEVLASKSQFK